MRAKTGLLAIAATCLAGAVSSACTGQLAPYGQLLVVADTDLPVPQIASRLRVDVYGADGTWIDSRDLEMPDPADWPVSFSVYTTATESLAIVRLRVYPEGVTRDYRGERFTPVPGAGALGADVPVPPPTPGPRLVRDGVDVTPPTEPDPTTAVDRLVSAELRYGSPVSLQILLHGACAGTMADLAGASTCVDQEGQRAPVTPPEASTGPSGPSRVGTFGLSPPCVGAARGATAAADGTALYDDDECVNGGPFLLGANDPTTIASIDGVDLTSAPQRVAVIPSIFVDRYEVTVGRWRDRVAHGFSPPVAPVANDAPLPQNDLGGDDNSFCTYSTMPLAGADNRESFAVTCVPNASARAFCQFEGGDLLTEAEWEFAASAAARPAKTTYPWGDDDATCAGVVFGRLDNPLIGDNSCRLLGQPFGAAPVTDGPQDVAGGLHGLAGGVSEWVVDSARSYSSLCWMSQPLEDPRCTNPSQKLWMLRGGTWTAGYQMLLAASRSVGDPQVSSDAGFRCMRRGAP